MAAPLVVQLVAAVASTGVIATIGSRLLRRAAAKDRIDPFTLTDPWRSFVQDAQSAHARFGRIVSAVDAGPLRERLTDIDTRIGDGERESWRIAQRGHSLHKMLLEVARDASGSESVARMRATEKETQDHLAGLIKSLDEAVARAAELATHQTQNFDSVADDVNGVVGDLEALRQAVVEVDRAAEPPQI